MSTVVIVKKAGKVAIAADSLTSFGDLRMGSEYDAAHDKIQKFEDSYLELLFEVISKLGFRAVTYMPTRNNTEQIKRIRGLCKKWATMTTRTPPATSKLGKT